MSRYLDSCGQLDFIASLIGTAYAQTASVFECQPTTDQSGRVFTPNIPDLYFNHTNAAAFRTGAGANLTTVTGDARTTFIYTTPPELVCSGTVTAIQYCYHTKINNRQNFLRFLSFSRDEFVITVKSARNIVGRAIPQDNICSDYPGSNGQRVCCDTTNLTDINKQFWIPSNFTFGVILLNNDDVRPLAFSGTADMKYQFPHYVIRVPRPGNPQTGSTFTLDKDTDYQSDGYLFLMRLLLGIIV